MSKSLSSTAVIIQIALLWLIARSIYPILQDSGPLALEYFLQHSRYPAGHPALVQYSLPRYFPQGVKALLCLGWERSTASGLAAKPGLSEQVSRSYVLRSL